MSLATHRRRGIALGFMIALTASIVAPSCSLFDKKVDVLYIGDSIMVQSGRFAESYLVSQPGVGTAKVKVDATNGTGLLTPDLVDWQTKAVELVNTYQPKVVVVLFIGNYTDGTTAPLWTIPPGGPTAGTQVPNEYGPTFYEQWAAQADRLTETLASKGAQVDWVLPPPLGGAEGERRQTAMRATYLDLAKRHPAIGTIDARLALGGPNGEWVWRRPGVDGGEVTVRAVDSVHLTDDGGRLVARQIGETVGPQLVEIRRRTA